MSKKLKTILSVILLAFIAGIIFTATLYGGNIIIENLKKNEETSIKCYECEAKQSLGARYCYKCGNEIMPKCKKCGNIINHDQDTKYCIKCGTQVE